MGHDLRLGPRRCALDPCGRCHFLDWFYRRLPDGWSPRFHVEQGPDSKQRIWMSHGGGFYLMEKLSKPTFMPKQLHWFKWEAAITWFQVWPC
ncbi:MAG: urate hydroxylase PuuD [Myxococcota bacterium]